MLLVLIAILFLKEKKFKIFKRQMYTNNLGPAPDTVVMLFFNATGLPAISLPCGFTQAGLPIGLQLAGRPFDEALVLRAAQAYEQATQWHTRIPQIPAAS